MLKIDFEYCDAMSNWEWRKQTCYVDSLRECMKIYGLGVDCDYRIINITDLDMVKKNAK